MDQNKNTQTTPVTNSKPTTPPAMPGVKAPATAGTTPVANPATGSVPGVPKAVPAVPQNNLVRKIVDKVKTSENILVALSRDPSVDEMAAAEGETTPTAVIV